MRPTASDFNEFFRGHVFGNHAIFSTRSYADFVLRNDIALERSILEWDGGSLIGALAYGLRGERAWFGLIGVHPAYRRDGIGKKMFVRAIDDVHAIGVTSIELEVSQKNAVTLAMCAGLGFVPTGELNVWARKPRPASNTRRDVRAQRESLDARASDACWQRELRSIELARSKSRIDVPGAFAYVRGDGEFATLLDAGAADADSAQMLLAELDACVPYDLTLNNEPGDSALTTALSASDWKIVERQVAMRLTSASRSSNA
jgi:GNAT superfamily N-acetyltransferase